MRGTVVLVLICLFANRAHAESEAEVRFREGRRLFKENQFAEACAEFARSQELEPMPGTLLSLGECQERRGLAASARETFLQAKQLARQLVDLRREAEAERRAFGLESQLARITLVVPREAAPGYTIKRNGVEIDAATWNTAVPIDPGVYTFEASAPGARSWNRTLEIGPRMQATLAIGSVAEPAHPPVAPARRLAFGVLLGSTVQREALLAGLRIVGAIDVPRGQIRGIATMHFSRYRDEPNVMPDYQTSTMSFALGAEYVWTPIPRFALGGGVAIGADYDRPNFKTDAGRANDVGTFLALRASPAIVRLRGGTLEAGLHLAVAIAGDEVVFNAVVAADWFVW